MDRNHQNINEIRDVIKRYGENAKIYLGGIPMIADDMMSYIKSDIIVFGIGVFIFIIFKHRDYFFSFVNSVYHLF